MTDRLLQTLAERDRVHSHIIQSLAHFPRETAMSMILSWTSLDDLHEIAPTLTGSPVPDDRPLPTLDERPRGEATIDYLVRHLNELVRGDFRILRGQIDGVHRYQLKAVFDGELVGEGHVFQGHRPLQLIEITRWLASICDMAAWGLLRLRRDEIK